MSRWRSGLLFVLTISAIYLYGFPSATIIYGGGVLLHAGAGILLAVLLIPILRHIFRDSPLEIRLGWLLITAGTFLGLVLLKVGTPNRFRVWLILHISICAAGILLIGTSWLARHGWFGTGLVGAAASFVILLCCSPESPLVPGGLAKSPGKMLTGWPTRN